jgi:hypothetical protein
MSPHPEVPEDPQATLQALGEPRVKFAFGPENFLAGIILGLLLCSAGILAACFELPAPPEAPDRSPVGRIILSLLLPVAGIALIVWVWKRSALRVLIFGGALVCARRNGLDIYRWDDIREVEEFVFRPTFLWRRKQAELADIFGKARRYLLSMTDGRTCQFDGHSVRHVQKLARIIREETDRRRIPWAVHETSTW